jgi:hypothetical protein
MTDIYCIYISSWGGGGGKINKCIINTGLCVIYLNCNFVICVFAWNSSSYMYNCVTIPTTYILFLIQISTKSEHSVCCSFRESFDAVTQGTETYSDWRAKLFLKPVQTSMNQGRCPIRPTWLRSLDELSAAGRDWRTLRPYTQSRYSDAFRRHRTVDPKTMIYRPSYMPVFRHEIMEIMAVMVVLIMTYVINPVIRMPNFVQSFNEF